MDWENHLEKNPIQKIEKNSKNQSEIAACEQKTTTEKPNFCSNTIFALYFKIRAKKIHAAKPLAFSLHFLFRRDQNHYSNLTSNKEHYNSRLELLTRLLIKTEIQILKSTLICKYKFATANQLCSTDIVILILFKQWAATKR